jgi:excisionase family DNA binding protein
MTEPGNRPGDRDSSGTPSGLRQFGVDARLLYRVEEAAEILALGRSTIYELLASGELKSIKIGRACRIAASELDRFVADLGS